MLPAFWPQLAGAGCAAVLPGVAAAGWLGGGQLAPAVWMEAIMGPWAVAVPAGVAAALAEDLGAAWVCTWVTLPAAGCDVVWETFPPSRPKA